MTDIRITTAQREYLAAFDDWLKNVWAKGLTGAAAAATPESERKDRALASVRREAGGLPCVGCRVRRVPAPGPGRSGRPRLYCLTCRPTRDA